MRTNYKATGNSAKTIMCSRAGQLPCFCEACESLYEVEQEEQDAIAELFNNPDDRHWLDDSEIIAFYSERLNAVNLPCIYQELGRKLFQKMIKTMDPKRVKRIIQESNLIALAK